MKKPLNTDTLASELREGSAFFRQARDQEPVSAMVGESSDQPADEPALRSASQPTSRPTKRPAEQSTNPSTVSVPGRRFDTSPILGRPKSFYITDQQDKALDAAVVKLAERLQGRGNQKIDRSTVMRLLLEVTDPTNDEMVGRLANQLVNRLVSQLTG